MAISEQLKTVLEGIKVSGKIDPATLHILSDEERQLVHDLKKENLVEEALAFLENVDTDQEWENLKEKLVSSQKPAVPLWKNVLKYAAIFVGFSAIVYFSQLENGETASETQVTQESIQLRVGEESSKIIQEGQTQELVSKSGQLAGQQKGNKLSYTSNNEINELVYSELTIPHGKVFDVELSDGTLVHLNSGTTMRYPIKFLEGQKREVFIEGECYFKVAKDENHPFIVHADDVAVEVLGTQFNISSYSEDSEIATVLVEGSVSLSTSKHPKENILLEPGQKAGWDKNIGNTEIEQVDVNLYTSWIKGEMIFRNATFKDMAQKLERRYNVTIENNNSLLANKILNARFNVEVETIEDVLKSIKEIQDFNFKINGQTIQID